MKFKKKIFLTFFCCACLLIADSGYETAAISESTLEIINSFWNAYNEGNNTQLDDLIIFGNARERAVVKKYCSNRKKLMSTTLPSNYYVCSESVLLSEKERLVLLFIPFRDDVFMPKILTLELVENGVERIRCSPIWFPSQEQKASMHPVDMAKKRLLALQEEWNDLALGELQEKVNVRKAEIYLQIQAVKYAQKKNIRIFSGFSKLHELEDTFHDVNNLSNEQFRRKTIEQINQQLSKYE